MSVHKISFVSMGTIYVVLLGWSLSIPSAGSATISAAGLLLCLGGWKFADSYL